MKKTKNCKNNNNNTVKQPKKSNLSKAFELLTKLPEDFFNSGRNNTPPQQR